MSAPLAPPQRHAELSAAHQAALRRLFDLIVPASDDGRLPSAATVGVPAFIDEREPALWATVSRDLQRLDALARAAHGADFDALPPAQAAALVDAQRAAQPGFLSDLALATVTCYYQQPAVLTAMNLEPRPPYPQGYSVIAGDLRLLEPVRRSGKRYREA
jgi:hypothetical protein